MSPSTWKLLILLCPFMLAFPSCRKIEPAEVPLLETEAGPLPWVTEGSRGLARETYLDRGERKHSLLVAADSSAILVFSSPPIEVKPGRPVSFSYAFRSLAAVGEILQVKLSLYDNKGNPLADSLFHRIEARGGDTGPGDTRGWIEYTRAIKVPEGTARVRVFLSSKPEKGQVWIGRTAFAGGEGWLAYASTFSTHLGRHPEDKYLFTAGRFIDSDSLCAPIEAETEAGLMYFERKGLVDAWPYANPRPEDRTAVLSEKVPRGAVAPFVLGVKALQNLTGVEVALSSQPSGANGVLRTRPVLYQGRYAATRLESSWGTVFGIRTRLLEEPGPRPLQRNENQFFWLDVPVPPNVEPGAYEGELTVSAVGHPALQVPFRVEVVGVDLPPLPEERVVGLYYYPPEDLALMEAQFRDMSEHGANSISLSGSFVELSPAGNVRLDWERIQRIDRIMGLMRRYGMFRPTALYVVDMFKKLGLPRRAADWTPQHKALFSEAIRQMDLTARQRGWCRLMFFAVDEPANDPESMDLARLTLGLLRSMPGIMPICDLNTPGSVEELSTFLDAVVIQISSVSPQTVGLVREKGLKTFFYLPAFGSADVGGDAAYQGAIPGFFLPRSGADGIYYFAYQSVEGDPYDELDGSHRDWCAAYPAPEPRYVYPSPEWQGIRRGIEDLRLVELTRQLIERCAAQTEPQAVQAGQAAGAKLEEILSQVKPSGPEVIYQLHHELPNYICDNWRQELLERVIEMQKTLGR